MTTLQADPGISFSTSTVTISSGNTASAAIDLNGYALCGIIMPAAFTGTTITFQMSPDNVTFYALYNTNNTQLSATVTQGRAYNFVPGDFASIRFLKVVSSSTEGSDRVLTLITRTLV